MPVGLRVICSTAANTHKNERLHERGTSEKGMESASARDMLDRPSQEAGSVLSTAKSFLELYRDPTVAKNTSRSEFRIRDLMHYTDPVSLYIITHPADKARLKPLVRIVVNMIVRRLADKMAFQNGRPKPTYKHKLLAMIDEFPALGKLEILQESLAFVAGYGIKCYLISQGRQPLYFQDATFAAGAKIPPPKHSDALGAVPVPDVQIS